MTEDSLLPFSFPNVDRKKITSGREATTLPCG